MGFLGIPPRFLRIPLRFLKIFEDPIKNLKDSNGIPKDSPQILWKLIKEILTTCPWTTRSWVRALCSTSVVSVAVIFRVISIWPFTSFWVCFWVAVWTSRP